MFITSKAEKRQRKHLNSSNIPKCWVCCLLYVWRCLVDFLCSVFGDLVLAVVVVAVVVVYATNRLDQVKIFYLCHTKKSYVFYCYLLRLSHHILTSSQLNHLVEVFLFCFFFFFFFSLSLSSFLCSSVCYFFTNISIALFISVWLGIFTFYSIVVCVGAHQDMA